MLNEGKFVDLILDEEEKLFQDHKRLVTKRVRELQRARAGLDDGLSPRDAAIAAGISPAIAWKFDGQIRAWRPPQLRRAVSRLLEAESQMKGGLRVDPRLALESAVLDVLR